MRKSTLVKPSSFVVQRPGRDPVVFDAILGEGAHNVAFHSADKKFVSKFQKDSDKSDNPFRQARVFEDLYGPNLEPQVIAYQGDDLLTRVEETNDKSAQKCEYVYVLARAGQNLLVMRFCDGEKPSDEEIALETLDLIVTRHRLVLDAHIKGNFTKLTKPVGELLVGRVVCIDVGNAFKLGRNPSLPHCYSQDSLDEWGYDNDGMRYAYRRHFNELDNRVARISNPITQQIVKSLIFLEESFPHFHHMLCLLKDNRAWWPVLEKAYHLFPYGFGLSSQVKGMTTLDQAFIDALTIENENRRRFFVTEFRRHRICLSKNERHELLDISDLSYCFGQLHQFNLLTRENLQRLWNFEYRSRVERAFQNFLPFGLLTRESVSLIMKDPGRVVCVCHTIQDSALPWDIATAALVLNHFEDLSLVMSKLLDMDLLNPRNLSAVLQSPVSLKIYRRTICLLEAAGLLNLLSLSKVLSDPSSFWQSVAVLRSVHLVFPDVLSKVLADTKASWSSLDILKHFELLERTHVARVVAHADEFSQHVDQLISMELITKEHVVRLLNAPVMKNEMALIWIQAGLSKALSDDHQFAQFNDIKKFACRSLVVESQLPGVDLQKLWMSVMRALSHCKDVSSVALWSAPVVYDVNQIGSSVNYFRKAQDLLNISDNQWQQNMRIPDWGSYEMAYGMVQKSPQRTDDCAVGF